MLKFNLTSFENKYSFFLALFLIFFTISPKISTPFLVFIILFYVYNLFKRNVAFRFEKYYLPLIILYFSYVLGVFYTENLHEALRGLENKLSLLIIPFLFSFRVENKLLFFKRIILGLIVGVTTTSFIGLVHAIFQFVHSKSILSFFTIGISPIHHPSYFVVFHIMASIFSIYGYRNNWKFLKKKTVITFLIFSFIFQCLCLSLAGLLFLFTMIFLGVLWWMKTKLNKIYFRIFAIILPFVFIGIFFSIPQFEGEFNGAFKYARSYFTNPEKFVKTRASNISGTEERLIMWTVSVQEIVNNPLGVGTGNVDSHLSKRLNSYGLNELASKNYNPHNQFFQISLEIGILSLLVFMLGLFFWFKLAYFNRFWPFLILLINFIFNSLFESMLQRQSGIVFYILFFCLFILFCSQKNQHEGIRRNSL
jgi:O-antigen ligase